MIIINTDQNKKHNKTIIPPRFNNITIDEELENYVVLLIISKILQMKFG